jgi:hypothetical protein
MDRVASRLWNPQQAHGEFAKAWHWAKAMLTAGHKLQLEVKPSTRSVEQNALLHALLTDISKQVVWAGSKRSPTIWKRLLVAAWCRAHNEQVELLPAIDGHGVDIVFRRTSQMTSGEITSLIDFIHAWCNENGVVYMDPATGEMLNAE